MQQRLNTFIKSLLIVSKINQFLTDLELNSRKLRIEKFEEQLQKLALILRLFFGQIKQILHNRQLSSISNVI